MKYINIFLLLGLLLLVFQQSLPAQNLLAGERTSPKNMSDRYDLRPRGWSWVDSLFDARDYPQYGGGWMDWCLGVDAGVGRKWISRDAVALWPLKNPKLKQPTFEQLYGKEGLGGFVATVMGDWWTPKNNDAELERFLIQQALNRLATDYALFPVLSAPFQQEFAALCRENPSTFDQRWMRLYARICLLHQQLAPLAGSGSIRASLETMVTQFGAEVTFNRRELLAEFDRLQTGILRQGQNPEQIAALTREYLDFRRKIWYGTKPVRQCVATTTTVDLRREWEAQLNNLYADLANRAWFKQVASSTYRPESLILDTDRDPADVVLRRALALLAELQATGTPQQVKRLAAPARELARLQQITAHLDPEQLDARYALYFALCRVRREISFANPLLDFNRLLFAKRHFMAPEVNFPFFIYQGCYALGGGGLFVLDKPFSATPVVRDLLATAVCENGRLQGKKLEQGAVLAPSLSYDGKTILFAYGEVPPERQRYISQLEDPLLWTNYIWTPETCNHLFRINVDGSGLRQLTDGPYNDNDPCWLPNGRIIFVSDRRGGFTRSRWWYLPGHTLFSMRADGSDMLRLSSHMNQEWNPTVDHQGNVLFTRYDYWDRGYNASLACWSTTPDGRNPRPVSGNYRGGVNGLGSEMNIQPIPQSTKFIATASPNVFGGAYGAFVVVDPAVPDPRIPGSVNDTVAFKRLTPELPIPYSEEDRSSGKVDYGTAWPLSEHYWLCVYDGNSGTYNGPDNNYGIYLMDAFGNKELLYRDPSISCLNPQPLAPRPMPPVIPDTAGHPPREPVRETIKAEDNGTVALINVYDSLLPFPKEVKIVALRIWAIVPRSTPIKDRPRTRMGENSGPRTCLGTVPVEADGSAYFTLPANIPLFFQALDEQGCAVQTMRSDMNVHRGELLTCMGCHEPKTQAPPPRAAYPLALRRAPSTIVPEVEGANPFSYARLVQPVLEKNCVACHARDTTGKAPDLSTGNWRQDPDRFFTSARSLFPYLDKSSFSFASHIGQPDRSVPGQFGARASRLYPLLQKGHHGVQLTAEEMRRLVVWLDSNGAVFGSDRDIERQAAGEVVPLEFNPVNDTSIDRPYAQGALAWVNTSWILSIKDATGFGTPTTDALEPGPGFRVLATPPEGKPATPLFFGRSGFYPRQSFLNTEQNLFWEDAFVTAHYPGKGLCLLLYQQLRSVSETTSAPLAAIEPLRVSFEQSAKNWTVIRPGGEVPMLVLLTGDDPQAFGIFCFLEWPGPGGYVNFENCTLSAGVRVHGLRLKPAEVLVAPRVHLGFFRGGREAGNRLLQSYLQDKGRLAKLTAGQRLFLPRNINAYPLFTHAAPEADLLQRGLQFGGDAADRELLQRLLGENDFASPENNWNGETYEHALQCLSAVQSVQHLPAQADNVTLPGELAGHGWFANLSVNSQQDEAFLLVLAGPNGGEGTLTLRGLKPEANYLVKQNWGQRATQSLTGAELLRDGFPVKLSPRQLGLWRFELQAKVQ